MRPRDLGQEDRIRRRPVRRVDLDLAHVLEQRVEARPAEHPDLRGFGHASPPSLSSSRRAAVPTFARILGPRPNRGGAGRRRRVLPRLARPPPNLMLDFRRVQALPFRMPIGGIFGMAGPALRGPRERTPDGLCRPLASRSEVSAEGPNQASRRSAAVRCLAGRQTATMTSWTTRPADTRRRIRPAGDAPAAVAAGTTAARAAGRHSAARRRSRLAPTGRPWTAVPR